MRTIFLALPVLALHACAPAPTAAPEGAASAAPFAVPMDPGGISCAHLSNPQALAAASEWAMGQARAAVLAGRIAAVPAAQDVASGLAAYCSGNRGDTVRRAVAQIGL